MNSETEIIKCICKVKVERKLHRQSHWDETDSHRDEKISKICDRQIVTFLTF